jgi:hypothetical protein
MVFGGTMLQFLVVCMIIGFISGFFLSRNEIVCMYLIFLSLFTINLIYSSLNILEKNKGKKLYFEYLKWKGVSSTKELLEMLQKDGVNPLEWINDEDGFRKDFSRYLEHKKGLSP